MSLQDTVWDLEAAIEESFGEDSYEMELFNRITQRLWQYEADVERLERIEDTVLNFKRLLNSLDNT